MRPTSVLFLVLLLLGLGCSSRSGEPPPPSERPDQADAPASPPRAPDTLTIGSYNLLYLRAAKRDGANPADWADPDTLRRVASLDVDVLLLQEANEAWESAIRATLSDRFPHCSFHWPKRYLPEGLGACSRHPLTDDTLLASPVGWFPAQRVRLQAPFGPVEILNVHLRPAVAGPGNWMEVHLATRPDRDREVQAYLATLPAADARLVVGDFNELPEGDLFRTLAAAGFQSALPRAGERGATWRWEGAVPPLEAQIDHVAYTGSSFELVSAQVLAGGNSDHVPIVVTLRHRR